MRHDQQKSPDDVLPPLTPLTSEKCSSPHHFIIVDGFPITLFLDGGATNGQWWKPAELDFKSVISTFVGFTCQRRFYFLSCFKSSVIVL